jgi:GNAT superfamily N-acetyltransferase
LADRPAVESLVRELGYAPDAGAGFSAAYDALIADGRLLVAASSDVLGLVTFEVHLALRLGAPVATIEELVVGANARGRGVGARLVSAAIERARSFGAVRIELQTRRSRESYARGFYTKQGFVEAESALFRADLSTRAK